MKVKELIKMLKTLPPNAEVDMASDEEGNSYGDIADSVARGTLQSNGKECYSLYPMNNQMPEDKFIF